MSQWNTKTEQEQPWHGQVDQSETRSALARLGDAQDRLEKEIEALAARLTPVLGPDHPSNPNAVPSEAGSAIHEAARIAEGQASRLSYITGRIEL